MIWVLSAITHATKGFLCTQHYHFKQFHSVETNYILRKPHLPHCQHYSLPSSLCIIVANKHANTKLYLWEKADWLILEFWCWSRFWGNKHFSYIDTAVNTARNVHFWFCRQHWAHCNKTLLDKLWGNNFWSILSIFFFVFCDNNTRKALSYWCILDNMYCSTDVSDRPAGTVRLSHPVPIINK